MEDGTQLFDMMKSCLRVFRSGASSCTNATEICCSGAGMWEIVC